ncbi:MAG: ATP synthase F1 subunit epsilon [Pirellulaceae bacterium]
MSELNCIVVTPEETAVEAVVDSVVVPLIDGEMGILPNHAAMIGRLGAGELRLRTGDQLERFFLEGGFIQIVDNTVSVLTGRAIPVEQLDAAAAEGQLEGALAEPAVGIEQMEARDQLVQQLRAQQRVARRSAK